MAPFTRQACCNFECVQRGIKFLHTERLADIAKHNYNQTKSSCEIVMQLAL